MTEDQIRACHIRTTDVNTIWFWSRTPMAEDGLYRSFAVHHYQDKIDVSYGCREKESLPELLNDYWGAKLGEEKLEWYSTPFDELPEQVQNAVLKAKVGVND